MSGASSSLDLSEIFNNDDSQGHRLAEFLQKRRGDLQRDHFLFMNCEPQHLSLNVQLEKIPPSQEVLCENNEKNHENGCSGGKDVNSAGKMNITSCITAGSKSSESRLHSKPLLPISNGSPLNGLASSNGLQPPGSLSPRALSPRLSTIRRSGGVLPNDRLRRYSLKRLTNLCGGRRTLLQEFENTIGETNFQPQVCSTPFSQSQQEELPSPFNSSQPLQTRNLETNSKAIGNSTSESCGHTETLINTLQRKDEELKNYMESLLENALKNAKCKEKVNNKSTENEPKTDATLHFSNSSLKRTYTIEKGNTSGQVKLTPQKDAVDNNVPDSIIETQPPSRSDLLRAHEEALSPKKSTPKSMGTQSNSSKLLVSHGGIKILGVNRSPGNQRKKAMSPKSKTAGHEMANNNLDINISIAYPSQNIEIPETHDQKNAKEGGVTIQSDIRVDVIPANEINSRACNEGLNKDTMSEAKTKASDNNLPSSQLQSLQEKLTEDNVKANDVLTDDEGDINAVSSRTVENDSQAPLNLAQNDTNLRRNRIRKCTVALRNVRVENFTYESDFPPQAHNNNYLMERKRIPLNKAPGIPLNGEKFAQELARMSNYEILDLRKRNSMGRVFAISGRKSRRSQEEALKKQNQLNDQIDKELHRRNINEIKRKQPEQNDNTNIQDESGAEKRLPAPDGFRDDSLVSERELQAELSETSLIDETPSDRVSLRKKDSNSRLTNPKKKEIPEVLKLYLEVSTLLSRKKKNKSFNNLKRLLYTQDHAESENINKLTEKPNLEERNSNYRNKKSSLPYIPSPPKPNDNLITTPKVISPPSPLSLIPRKSRENKKQQITTSEIEENSYHNTTSLDNNIALPPPPPGFENNSNVSFNNIKNYSTTTSKFQITKENTESTTQLNINQNVDNSEDIVFKKPQPQVGKSRLRKRKENKTPPRDIQVSSIEPQQSVDNSTVSTNGTLRRSKRGHVPLKYSVPLFQLLFQQSINTRLQYFEKQKQKKREISKIRKSSTSNNSNGSISRQKSTQTKKYGKNKKELPTVLENEPCITSTQKTAVVLNGKKKTTKTKNTKLKNQQKQSHGEIIVPNENIEGSRLILNSPPPIDHLNNVFDQLRHTNCTVESTSGNMLPPPPPQKLKSLKVRVARLKSSKQPLDCNSISTTSSTIEKNSNYELISWLKNISESDGHIARNDAIFKEMRISAASNLSFTELQGVEYAFYDTEDKASLGYLRFKPRQIKPKKRAKRFHLHFITLVGHFRITANDKESRVGVGDMVAIEKSVYYDIENLTDDIGILMVIKK